MSDPVSDERPTITICGLGPGSPDLLTERTVAVLERTDPLFLRTTRHPGADRLAADAMSFDAVYDSAPSFAEVYTTITESLVSAATANGRVTYCVPGSPLVLERSVAQLLSRTDIAIELVPAISFLDEVWARLAVDPVDAGVRLVDGHRFRVEAAGERGPLLVAHAHARWVLSDIKLALLEHDAGGDQAVIVLQRLGTGDETIFEVPIAELDRRVEADHLTSLYVPTVAAPIGQALIGSVELMRRLRTECPWDAEQDHASLRKYLLEETHEVLEVLDRIVDIRSAESNDESADDGGTALTAPADDALLDAFDELEGELGDLLLQVLFHSHLAAEAGHFDIADVADTLITKMVSRHPHVFGVENPDLFTTASGERASTAAVEAQWDQLKAGENQRSSILDGIPTAMPSLARAAKIIKRVSKEHGPPDLGPWAERLGLGAETTAPVVRDEADLGRLLLAVVEAGRIAGVDGEQALRTAVNALAASVRSHELPAAASEGDPPSSAAVDRLAWVVG